MNSNLIVTSSAFNDGGKIPRRYTGNGEDISPDFNLKNINEAGRSIAITMDDLGIPFISSYCHWIAWNIPIMNKIPENIKKGSVVKEPFNVVQGIGYGKHGYRGPNIPVFLRSRHEYLFTIYIFDCNMNLSPDIKKKEFLQNIKSHILQKAELRGTFANSDLKK